MRTHPNWVFFEIQWTNKFDPKYRNILLLSSNTTTYYKKYANISVMQKWKHYLEIGLWLQDHKWYFLVVLWTKKCWLIELNLTLSSDMAWLPIDNQPTPYSISIIMKKYQCIVKRLDCKPICKKVYLVIYLLYKKVL